MPSEITFQQPPQGSASYGLTASALALPKRV